MILLSAEVLLQLKNDKGSLGSFYQIQPARQGQTPLSHKKRITGSVSSDLTKVLLILPITSEYFFGFLFHQFSTTPIMTPIGTRTALS